jgi:hypothetical protein
MLSKCINWFEVQEVTNAIEVVHIGKIRNIAPQKTRASKIEDDKDFI